MITYIDGDTGKIMYVQSFSKIPSKWCEALHHGAIYKLSVIRENHLSMPSVIPDDFIFISNYNLYAQSTFFVRKSVYNWLLHSQSVSHHNWEISSWRGYHLLDTISSACQELKNNPNNHLRNSDIDELNLFLVKNYYYYIVKDVSATRPIQRAYKDYINMKQLVQKNVPNYKSIIFRRNVRNSPFRRSVHIEITILSFLEKFGLLFPAVIVYGVVTRATKKHAM